jgi:hypothetical protein
MVTDLERRLYAIHGPGSTEEKATSRRRKMMRQQGGGTVVQGHERRRWEWKMWGEHTIKKREDTEPTCKEAK